MLKNLFLATIIGLSFSEIVCASSRETPRLSKYKPNFKIDYQCNGFEICLFKKNSNNYNFIEGILLPFLFDKETLKFGPEEITLFFVKGNPHKIYGFSKKDSKYEKMISSIIARGL